MLMLHSAHFYFLTACISLATVQVQHLDSPERLAFGSASLPRIASKRQHSVPFLLADLVTRCSFCLLGRC